MYIIDFDMADEQFFAGSRKFTHPDYLPESSKPLMLTVLDCTCTTFRYYTK